MKKGIMVLLSALICLSACGDNEATSTSSLSFMKEDTVISKNESHTDYPKPKDLNELEERSEDIVKVKVTPNVVIGTENEETGYVSTVREVEVIGVFKGSFEPKQIIKVSEPYYLTANQEYKQLEGYTPLESGKEYLLFLRFGHEGDKVSGIVGLDFGKYSENGLVQEGSITKLKSVKELKGIDFLKEEKEDVESYKKIKTIALEKYKNK